MCREEAIRINLLSVRRPLCLAGLAFAAAVAAAACTVRGAPVYEELDRKTVTAAGYVKYTEYKETAAGKTPVVTLSEAAVLTESHISSLEQFLLRSDQLSQRGLHHFWKENRKTLQDQDTEGIEGVLCYMDADDMPPVGSLVVVAGDFRAFTHASNPGEFDSADYYRIMGQQGRIMNCRCLARSASYSVFRDKLNRLKEYLGLLADHCFDPEDASVIKAMLLGEKGTLNGDIKELYRQNGILHILAISGLHLSVIGMGLHRIMKRMRFPDTVNIILSAAFMYGYGVMSGLGISMLRAYIMFGLHLGAELIGRTYDLLTALAAAALLMLSSQPLYVQHSGFLFSFGAICGIGVFLPAAQENQLGTGRWEKALLSGTAISLSTLPVYLRFYYEFPPYSILLNLLVIPCMTFVLAGGLAALGVAACCLPLGTAAAYPVHLMLAFYKKCCGFFIRIPGSRWAAGCPETWQIAFFLAILAGAVLRNRKMSKMHFWLCVLCALRVLSIRLPQGLQITMLDVGQGDCICLTEDGGMNLLIDGGSSDKSNVAEYQIMPYLKHEGVSYLDAVVVTHPDSDHISGIRELLEQPETDRIAVGALYLPDVGETGRNEAYHDLEDAAGRAGADVRYLGRGDTLKFGKVMLICIHPETGWDTEDVNAYSTVLYLTYGGFSALFTGDLEGEGEDRVTKTMQDLKNRGLRGVTLLKVAHHGSGNSTGGDFLNAVEPKIALISSGRNNRYGHPHEELLQRLTEAGCRIYGTQESGAVTVYVKSGRVRVEEYCR